MANYDVDIKIALKGSQKLKQLTDQLKATNKEVGKLNAATIKAAKSQDESFSIKKIQNINNYSKAVAKAERTLRRAAAGTEQEQLAVKALVAARKQHNQQLERQNKLLKEEELLQGVGRRPKVKGSNRISASSGLSSPLMGAQDIKGSPMERAFGYKPGAGGKGGGGGFGGLQSAALGVGFPLLFGGGAGSVLGGLAGSAGGFGGQVFGSAIGQQLDQFAQKTAELGVALSKAGLDVGAVTKAAGELGSEAERLISELKEVAGAEEAATVAADLLANKIGEDGVRALEEFGAAGQELGAAISELNTEFMVLAATLLGPVVKGIAGLIERANLASQTSTILRGGGPEAERLRSVGQKVVEAGGSADDKNIAMQNEAAKILEERRRKALQAAKDASAQNSISLQILESEGDLLKGKSDLMEKTNYLKAIEIEGLKLEKALRKENITELEKKQELQKYNNNIQELQNQRDKAFASQAEKERREAEKAAKKLEEARKKENAILRTINELIISNYEISLQSLEIAGGEEEALSRQAASLFEKFRILKENVKLSTEDARVKELQLKKLDLQKQLESNQIGSRQRTLQVEKAITAEKQKQTLAAIGTDVGRQIQDADLRSTGNRDQDAQIALRISQIRRQEDATTRLTNAIREQQITINNPPNADAAMKAEEERKNLQDQLDLYNQLLPQLDAAEQAQLKFNQALQAAQPFADAFTSGLFNGLVAVVDGTKTAEQAFADFLRNISDLLLQTVQQMIAQYIALGIARMFAIPGNYSLPGGGMPFGGSGAAPAGLNTSNLTGFFNPGAFMGRANGGSVSGGQPYLVGERGPELFVPGAQGNIVPNNAMGSASVTVNVDATGSNVEGDENQSKQLGKAIGAAVQAELVKQKRPGGLLAS